jgi:hypothetical protein
MNPNLRLVQSDHVFSQSHLITINLDFASANWPYVYSHDVGTDKVLKLFESLFRHSVYLSHAVVSWRSFVAAFFCRRAHIAALICRALKYRRFVQDILVFCCHV